MSDNDVSAFGELLRSLRQARGISQHHLAARLDVHRNTIGKWERGVCLPESKTIVLELARQLQLDPDDTQRLLEASLTAFLQHWYMPSPRNLFFTGRDAVLHYLHTMLGPEQTATLYQSYALSGLGGVGKTQVAIEYAYQHAQDYTAVLWVAAETKESIVASFMELANVLRLTERRDQHQDCIMKAVSQWLNEHREWLLILDNVENLELIKPLLPAARSGAILITTRLQNMGGLAQTIHLQPMTPTESLLFLLCRAGLLTSDMEENQPPTSQELQAAHELVLLMDGLPLALDQAGAYIEATQCSLQDYLQLLQVSQQRLLNEREMYADHPLSVTQTFTLAFEQLKRNHPQAAELLTICAFLAPEGILESFFSEGAASLGPAVQELTTDPFRFNAAIKALQVYSFVQRNSPARMITVHRLVQAVLKGSLSEEDQRQWEKRVTHAMSQLFPSNEYTQADYWHMGERLLPHASACIAQCEQWNEDGEAYIVLLNHVAAYLSGRIQYAEAESLYLRALTLGERTLGTDHAYVTETLCGLAILHFKQDRYEEAESLYLRVMHIRAHAQEAEYPLMARALNGLATIYYRQGKYWEAVPLYRRALHAQEQTLGGRHPHVAMTLNSLASTYGELGKYWEAELLYKRALLIQKQTLGSEHPQIATILNNLAELYREHRKYQEAEPLYLRALHIWEQTLEAQHPRVAHSFHGLAELYKEQGRYQEAESFYRRALHIWEQKLGGEHSLVAEPLHGLAELYKEQGKYQEAEPLYRRALRIRERALGPEHPATAATLHDLAYFYQTQQQMGKAQAFYQRALAIREQTLGLSHTKTQETRAALSLLIAHMSDERAISIVGLQRKE